MSSFDTKSISYNYAITRQLFETKKIIKPIDDEISKFIYFQSNIYISLVNMQHLILINNQQILV